MREKRHRVMEASGRGGDALKVCYGNECVPEGRGPFLENEVVDLLVLSAQNTWVYAQVCFQG